MVSSPDRSLGARTMQGMFWAYGSYVGARAVVLVATAILARLLTPADFGVVALALVFMGFMETLQDLGLTQALIVSSPAEEPAQAQTTFIWTVTIGGILAIAVSALAPLIAEFFGHSTLRAMIPVLALSFFIESLGATHESLARKRLDYRIRTFAEGANVLTRGATSIALALAGFGAWSLVLGYLIGTTARTATLWALVSFRPRLRFSREHLGKLARLGGVLTVVDAGVGLGQNLDYLFIGRVLGAASLGLYTIGFRLPELLIMNIAVVAANVLFPAFSALEEESRESGFLLSLRYLSAIVFPLGLGLALLANPLVLALFGPKWHGSIAVTQILAAYAVLSTLNTPAGTIYKVSGRASILLAVIVPYLIVLFLALLIFADQGIVAVALCLTASVAIAATVSIAIAGKILAIPYRRIGGVMAAPLGAALGMGAVVFPISQLLERPWPTLLTAGAAGVAAYALLLRLLAPDIPHRLLGNVIARFSRRAPVEHGA